MIRFQSLCNSFPFKRFQFGSDSTVKQICTSSCLNIQISPCLWSEPMKRKKRVDPALIKQREERKIKRLEKRIRQIKKIGRILKPIEENKVPQVLFDELDIRKRPLVELSEEVVEERLRLFKEWAKARISERTDCENTLRRLLNSQEKALQELRLESEELYQAAVEIDSNLLPFQFTGPNETPPVENYNPPDGDYIEIQKTWK